MNLVEAWRPLIMGILNVTPDSFSDGGEFMGVDAAVRQGLAMAAQGADIIDIGGESTRPGADPVSESEQIRRVLPVIRKLRSALPVGCLLSIDTQSPGVAEAAIDAGADLVNDISAGLASADDMIRLVARRGIPIVLMHMQGTPKTMQDDPVYGNVVAEVRSFLLERAQCALAAGLGRGHVILDPGIGFGKRKADNLALLANLEQFVETGFTIMLGTSRKRFMGAICNELKPGNLLGATVATTALGVAKGVRIFRVHDVGPNRQAADVSYAIQRAVRPSRINDH